MEFDVLRNTYPKFIYHNYEIKEDAETIIFEFYFEIEHLKEFHPKIEILKKEFVFENLDSNIVRNMVFNIGMVEAISYFKATCSPQFVIKCGKLDEYQELWYQKLYYLGLGEFRFVNKISVLQKDFVKFISEGKSLILENSTKEFDGIIIPIGGGKDSNVTLDLLKDYKNKSLAFCIGGKKVSLECAKIAGFENKEIIEVKRILDKNIIELNKQGYLNGHTPFSAIIAMITFLIAYMLGKKYIALSNENSANESNVEGENINHQYSKTIEFENDFREYAERYLNAPIEYFSMLRPISELQIAMLFSELEVFHPIFKSCNVGSKTEPWEWCCNCPKCLFVYTILSPFLYKEKLVNIFGEDLFEREDLLKIFIELCGFGETKPFECVGTYAEVQYAITKTIQNQKEKLPFLLEYYQKHFPLTEIEMLQEYQENHNVPEEFERILKKHIFNKNHSK